MPGLDEVLAPDGWPYASSAVARRRAIPGASTPVRARLAHHGAGGAARAPRRRGGDAARAGRASRARARTSRGTRSRARSSTRCAPGVVRRAPGLPGARGARRRAALLRLGRRDAVVPARAGGDRRRRAGRRARARLARGGRLAARRAGARRRPAALAPARRRAASCQQGWRDTGRPASARRRRAAGSCTRTARVPEPPVADADTQAAALAGLRGAGARCRATAAHAAAADALAARIGAAFGPRDDGARRARPARCAARARSSAGCCGPGAPVAGAAERLAAARRAHRLRAAHAVGPPPAASTRSPTTAARSGRSTRGWAGAGCARPGTRRRPSASAHGVLAGVERIGRYPELYAVTDAGPEARSLSPTTCRRGPSARCGRCATNGTGARMWWRDGVLYQVYPRSFADSDGDGIGDLRGITARLDHLEWLGVDGLWLNPTFPSPNADWGFDVSDYCGVHPELGTLEDLDELVARAGERGIRVLLDLVPNHTSDQHPWFRERRDFYVLARGPQRRAAQQLEEHLRRPGVDARRAPAASGTCTTSRPSSPTSTGGTRTCATSSTTSCASGSTAASPASASTSRTGSSRTASCATTRRATEDDTDHERWLGQRLEYSTEPPGGPRRLPPLARGRSTRDDGGARWARRGCSTSSSSCASTATTSTSCTWRSTSSSCTPTSRRRSSRRSSPRPRRCCPSTRGRCGRCGNHDMVRFPTRWARGDPALARCALMLLLTLRGTPVLYYGDELAHARRPRSPPERMVDPVGLRNDPERPGRDGARTPMPWSDEPGAGFTAPGAEPWLPFGDLAGVNVAAQRADPGSPLHLDPRPHRAAARRGRPARGRLRRGRGRRTGCGPTGAATASSWRSTSGRTPRACPAAGTIAIGTHRAARRRGDRGVAAAGARRGRGPAPGVRAAAPSVGGAQNSIIEGGEWAAVRAPAVVLRRARRSNQSGFSSVFEGNPDWFARGRPRAPARGDTPFPR